MLRDAGCLARRFALLGGVADGERCHVQRLGGRTVRDAFCLSAKRCEVRFISRGALLCLRAVADGLADAAGCLAGAVWGGRFG